MTLYICNKIKSIDFVVVGGANNVGETSFPFGDLFWLRAQHYEL